MKSQAPAVAAIVYIGVVAISALLFGKLPDMVNEIKTLLDQQATAEQAKAIADLYGLSSTTPDEIKITHDLPASYKLSISNHYVNIAGNQKSIAKTISNIELPANDVSGKIVITKP